MSDERRERGMSEPTTMPNELDAGTDARVENYAIAYREYWNAQSDWFDNGRYSEGVPRLDRLLVELREKEGILRAAMPNAADAVGAVGVSLAQVDELIAATENAYAGYADVHTPYGSGRLAALHEVRALLTNQQPAAPTSDGGSECWIEEVGLG